MVVVEEVQVTAMEQLQVIHKEQTLVQMEMVMLL